MNNSSLVSIITIFLNAEDFIQEAIESVLSQSYTNWELILVDDGSSDNSTVIAQQYAQQYPNKVHYLEHENHKNCGMSASRNLGIQHSQGEYIAFLDADDVWLPQNLERYVSLLESNPKAGMVYGDTHYWYSWTGETADLGKDFCDRVAQLTGKPNTLFQPPNLLTLFLENGGAVPCTCSLMVRRQVLQAIGGFESSFRGMYEDQAFYAKVCLHAPVFVTSECWSNYRRHPNSCCSTASHLNQEHYARQFFLEWLEQYLTQQEVDHKRLLKALQRQLRPYRHPTLDKVSNTIQRLSRYTLSLTKRINEMVS